ncbi:MAG TPA: hypothetical protein VGI81_03145 [Tepidisphaeraceae bacterium]
MISPFLLVTDTRLVFGNLLIGLIEAAAIALIFKVPRRRLFGWVIAGNYFSALVGAFVLPVMASLISPIALGPVPMFHVTRLLAAMYVVALGSSFVLEWPFVYRAFRGTPNRSRQSVIACALAQVVSYAILLPLYLAASTQTLGETKLTPSLRFSKNPTASIYFISPDEKSLLRTRLDGSAPEAVASLPPHEGVR